MHFPSSKYNPSGVNLAMMLWSQCSFSFKLDHERLQCLSILDTRQQKGQMIGMKVIFLFLQHKREFNCLGLYLFQATNTYQDDFSE